QLQLRPRGADRRPPRQCPPPVSDEELPDPAADLTGRPLPVPWRRVRAYAARQQQRLLPGQRDLLGRLGLCPGERGAVALHQDDDRLAPALLRHLPRRVHPQDDLARHTVRRPGLDRKEPDLGVPDAWLARPAGPPRDAQRPLGDATVRPPAAPGAVVLEAPGRYRLALAGRHHRGGERRAGPAGGPLLPVAAVDCHPHLVVRGRTKGAHIPAPFNTTIIIFSTTEDEARITHLHTRN